MEDYRKAVESISETMQKIKEPLTDNQKIILSGSLAVWCEKWRTEGMAEGSEKVLKYMAEHEI